MQVYIGENTWVNFKSMSWGVQMQILKQKTCKPFNMLSLETFKITCLADLRFQALWNSSEADLINSRIYFNFETQLVDLPKKAEVQATKGFSSLT